MVGNNTDMSEADRAVVENSQYLARAALGLALELDTTQRAAPCGDPLAACFDQYEKNGGVAIRR